MQTEEFTKNIELLIEIAKESQIAVMCAEAVPWRCHRSLIGDALLTRHIEVIDIMDIKNSKPHSMTSFAQVHKDIITYPVVADSN